MRNNTGYKNFLYVTSDGISNTLMKEVMYKKETFINLVIFSSILTGKEIYIKSSRKCLLILLLLVCHNIEPCPGLQILKNILQTKGIKIFHQNFTGLFRNVTNFTPLFSGEKNIVITLTEMHIESYSDYDNISLYNIPRYNFIKENRSYGKNGGVAVYILDNIKWNRRLNLKMR